MLTRRWIGSCPSLIIRYITVDFPFTVIVLDYLKIFMEGLLLILVNFNVLVLTIVMYLHR